MKEIAIAIICLIVANYLYGIETYFDNKHREHFLEKLKSNKCTQSEIKTELLKYSWSIEKVIKIFALQGSNKSDLAIFRDEIINLSQKANKEQLTINEKILIENIFSKKLRNIGWFPFFTKKDELTRDFLWINK